MIIRFIAAFGLLVTGVIGSQVAPASAEAVQVSPARQTATADLTTAEVCVNSGDLRTRSSWTGEWNDGVASSAYYGPPFVQFTGVTATVKTVGDYVYVRDDRADGCSALGIWYILESSGYRKGICRNTHGAGTWARCNKNWPEGVRMSVQPGLYDGGSVQKFRIFYDTVYFHA